MKSYGQNCLDGNDAAGARDELDQISRVARGDVVIGYDPHIIGLGAAAPDTHCRTPTRGAVGVLNLFRRNASELVRKLTRGNISNRARLQSLVDRLELPADWTVEEFITVVEHMRGRRIVQLPLPHTAPVGLCGLWLACKEYDAIFLRQSSDPTVELHVALHEVSHMLLGHGRDTAITAVDWAALTNGAAPDQAIDMSTVRAARGVSSYASSEEYEAELLATLIGFRARTDGPRRDPMLKEL